MKTASSFREYIKPTLVLFLICLMVTLILAATYNITKPIIEQINLERANAARMAVFPDADTFMPAADVDNILDGVKEIYTADSGGYVFTITDKGFGGEITIMVGVTTAGEITGVQVVSHTETPGLGTKATTPEHLSQYLGRTSMERSDVDAVTGATITSNAVYRCVEKALAQFQQMGGIE